ncbi:MAG: S8 family serine peptidase [Acidobacteriaceae bacterium]|nr:S8 family serine peptidase [Acidobacteriaceae bacterium]MBV9498099.1 S8 family serine peptidase [Acidobacteriaceae bacterium]
MSSHVILRDSHREHPAGSVPVGQPAPDQPTQITVVLRRRTPISDDGCLGVHLSHAEFAGAYGAEPADIRALEDFAAEHGFSFASVNAGGRTVVLSGPLAAMAAAFGADIELRRWNGKVMRTRQGHLHVPVTLEDCVVAVLGFDQRPASATDRSFRPRAAQAVYFTPLQVAKLYDFPNNNGAGQTIAMIELGGGYNNSDLYSYWSALGAKNVPVSSVSVDGAQNSPTGDPNSADGEVALDIEVAGGVATGARIAVYFAPNTDQGFLDAINAAIHDSVRTPSVISISWGAPESDWTPQAMNAFNAAFHDAALLGISVCAAAGDNGSSDGDTDGRTHVDFPASSPWVLACGGTKLVGANGTIQSESVWNDGADGGATGGGVSSHFSKPAYQGNIHVPKPWGTANPNGRGVPDVAGVADPNTGFAVIVDGQEGVVGGTSAVAPLWAALIALLNQELGRNLGWIHPKLYNTLAPKNALRDITSGSNGAYRAGIGWDPCTGLGSPNGQAMLNLLKN